MDSNRLRKLRNIIWGIYIYINNDVNRGNRRKMKNGNSDITI